MDRWRAFSPDMQASDIETEDLSPAQLDRFRPQTAAALPAPEPAHGDTPLPLSVEDATLMALRNNRDLRVRQIAPVIAGAFEKIERGAFDAELFAEFTTGEEIASETSRATGEQFDVDASDTDIQAGIRQRLPTGTTVEISMAHQRRQSNRAPDQEISRAGLSITQSLLRDFGPAVNLIDVRQAELATRASIHEFQGYAESLVAETEIAYWNYTLALEEISIYESSLAVAKQQLAEVKAQIDVGLLPAMEAAAAEAEAALRQQALINARSLLEKRRLQLLRLINAGDPALDQKIQAVTRPWTAPEPIRDHADRIALAKAARPDLNEARLRMEQGRLETIASHNGLLPKLDFFIALGKTGYAKSVSESFRNLDSNTYDFTTGLRLSYHLRNRSAKGRHDSALASRRQAELAVDNLRQAVELDVRLAVNEVERSRQQVSASRVTRHHEEKTLAAEKERFKVGEGTALLVAQAQRDLLISQIEEVRAIINYRIALVELYLSEGSLLQRRGVKIADHKAP